MSLSAGTKLGPYEIIAPLGAGGMGEVYRARDSRLGREVAVKILPESVAHDADRLHRFEQEARAVGALNHPNILAVYDVGTCNGVPYMISELLNGETLRSHLSVGPLPTRKAIDYGIQIANGLTAAHDRGIVHRDLKPENIFLNREGRLKILDFGLAKLAQPNLPADATRTVNTEAGTVLGTVGYMSPEQVRGKAIDARSDLFSFGAIFYEMISGERAFKGDSAADTMSAILTKEPPELLPGDSHVPAALAHVVRHCLEKNCEERFQSAHDIAFNLQLVNSTSGTASSIPKVGTRLPGLRLLGILTVLGATLSAGMFVLGRATTPHAAMAAYKPLTFRRGTVLDARYAPDGRTVIYSASWDGGPTELFSVRADVPASVPLGISNADVVSVSHTGEMALVLKRHAAAGGNWVNTATQILPLFLGVLARAPLNGGSPRPILADVLDADWANDGHDLVVTHFENQHVRLEYPIGKVLYEEPGQGYLSHPRFSPKGDKIAFIEHPVQGDDKGTVMIANLSGQTKVLSTGWASIRGVAWAPSGDEVWFTASETGFADAVFAVSLSGRQRILARLLPDFTLQDVTADGHVLVVHSLLNGHIFVRGPGASTEQELRFLELSSPSYLSADGKYLLNGGFSSNQYGVFLRPTDGSPPVRLGDGVPEALSADGSLALGHTITSPVQLTLLPIGAGTPHQITHDEIDHHDAQFLKADEIIFGGFSQGHSRVYIQSLKDGAQPQSVGPEGLQSPLPSNNGKSFAARLGPSVVTCPLADCSHPQVIPGLTDMDYVLNWTADDRHLFVGQFGIPYKIFRVDPSTGEKELVKQLAPSDPAGIQGVAALITPDGKYYAYGVAQVLSDLYEVDNLK